MAATTDIGWADATVNFWLGCTKVGPCCEDCYAVPIAAQMGIAWGDDAPRHRTGEETWRAPLRWNAMHDRGQTHMIVRGESVPVPLWWFANSLSDFFDNHPSISAKMREEAWGVIRRTPLGRWIILTKRIPNVVKMLPADWESGRNYRHVGIVASVGDQAEFYRDVPRLVALKALGARWAGLSIEPQLGEVSILGSEEARKFDWIISGGESRQLWVPRKYLLAWPRLLIEQCREFSIPYFHKQIGSLAFDGERRTYTKHPAGADPAEWPLDLRVQQMPRIYDKELRPISQPTLL